MKKIIVVIIIIIVTVSCKDNARRDNVHSSSMPIERMDRLVYNYNDMDSTTRFNLIDSMRPGLDIYIPIIGLSGDSVDYNVALKMLSASQPVKVFTPDVEIRLKSIEGIEARLGEALPRLQSALPKTKVSHIYGIVSPYRQSVVTADSIVLISLNLYLGSDYPGYAGFEDYFKKTREASRIPYDVVEAIVASRYPLDSSKSKTILSKMLYQGVLVHAIMSTIPDAELPMAIGVSDKELEWLKANESAIWDKMIQNELIYSGSEIDAAKLIMPSPSTSIIHYDAPGRVGRYIGYAIVKSYVDKHNDVTLESLINPDFYGATKTLIDAGYEPSR